MIGKVLRGRSAGGLIRYLFGPGRANAHEQPHVVAGWDDPGRLEPPLTPQGRRDFRGLVDGLNVPLAGADAPERCVWHCSLRAAPDDPILSDQQWADVAAEVMDRTGLAPRGDAGGCRWVAVRHADDHVHLVVTLARQDGRRAALHNDFYRVGEACRAVEERYGLRVTAGRDRTAARRPVRAEIEKAARIGQPEAARDRLRREVQTAAAGSTGEGEFLGRLRSAGVMVRERYSEQDPGQRTGYAVAWPGFRNRDGEPVWYGGAKLAADLSLPKLRRHWAGHAPDGRPRGSGCVSVRVRLRHTVETVAVASDDLPSFLAGLRGAGLLVRERYSEQLAGEITGYAVALPGDRDGNGGPVWYGGAKLASDLSLPRLQAGWGTAPTGERPRPGRVDPGDRPALWREATDVATNAAAEVRRLARQDPAAAGAAARAAADLLHVAARVAEPAGRGVLHDAARAYDRASRELHGRTPRPGPAGAQLRLAAASLGLLARAGRDEHAAVLALTVALSGLMEAVAELRAVQARGEQAAAARTAAEHLRAAATPPSTVIPTAPAVQAPRQAMATRQQGPQRRR